MLGATTYNFTRDLSYKQKGDDVQALQELLVTQGYLSDAPTGYFGKKTEVALKAYQKAHGIRATGVLGPLTRASLSNAMAVSQPSTSVLAQIALLLAQVQILQAKLAALKA